ncbi:hypothetical protein BASA81_008339 [Batrachochytrium salamandrivorans]|nr:hypothetical protein BASA81_008339 [Batrachochytrium salamandrivorans]
MLSCFRPQSRPQSTKEDIKQRGKVNTWMECVVLMEGNERFNRPITLQADKYTNNPMVAAGIIVPPNHSSIRGTRSATASSPYQHLPNPKQLFAQDRAMYDLALEQQLRMETAKLNALQTQPDATNSEISNQVNLVQQLEHQQQLQHRQQPRSLQPQVQLRQTLEEALKDLFAEHDPQALLDGRMERVYFWAQQHTMEELNSMLRKQYGRELGNVEMDLVDVNKLAARLNSFYKSINVLTMSEAECVKIAQWAAVAGEAVLNTKLRNKYNEDLDQYAAKVRTVVGSKLEALYAKHNPELLLQEESADPLLQWAVDHGVFSLNELLLDKFGEDLDGKRRDRGTSDFEV